MKQLNNSLHLPQLRSDTRTIANKVMAVASGQINSQSEHDLICPEAKVKATRSAQRIPWRCNTFLAYLLFPSNPTLKPRENIYYTEKRRQDPLHCPRIYVSTTFGE